MKSNILFHQKRFSVVRKKCLYFCFGSRWFEISTERTGK